MKRFALGFILLLVLCSVMVSLPEINIVKASGTIYIRADGTVEGTDKIQRDGDLYTFTSNISIDTGFYGIIVERDNIVIDGAGFTLKGDGSQECGIPLSDDNNVIIRNLQISNFKHGIWLHDSNNNIISENIIRGNSGACILVRGSSNTILGNNLTKSHTGIYLGGSNNVLRNNRMNNNSYNFILRSGLVNVVDSSNTVEDKPVYYWVNQHDKTVPSDAGYVVLVSCTNITIQNLSLSYNGEGIFLAYTTNSIITNNTLTNMSIGIMFYGSSNNYIIGNDITNNTYGLYFSRGTLVSPTYHPSPNNKIYHNNFVNNQKVVYDIAGSLWFSDLTPAVNIWDDGYPSGGNYWSDYTGEDANGDGIGDTPYVIDEKNQDNYPLMTYLGSPPPDTTPPTISIISPENKTYAVTDVPLTFTVSESTSWMGYSLDAQANVTITGNKTLTGLPDGFHCLTVYANDTAGNIGASETIYFSIKTEPFPTTWIVVAIAITAAVGAAPLVYFIKNKKTTGKAEK